MRVVSNAGPLIHLSWIGRLELLHDLFEAVLVPPAVRDEVLQASPNIPGVEALRAAFAASWLTVRPPGTPSAAEQLKADLDPGESEAIILMEETRADLLLLDDRRARIHAQRRNLPISGLRVEKP